MVPPALKLRQSRPASSALNRYFWLLTRFISDGQTREERQVIYDRARSALLDQLAEAHTSGPQAAFERLTFEEAVRTVEAGIARWGRHDLA